MIVLMIQRYAESIGIENGNQFAIKTGLPSGRAWKIWNEQVIPTLATLNQICAAFHCSLSDLVMYADGKNSIRWLKKNDPLLTKKRPTRDRSPRKNGTKA